MDLLRAHHALADPSRLAIAQTLLTRDLSPGEIGALWGLSTPLVAHHVRTLVEAGLAVRRSGEHDGRKSYLSLRRDDPDVVALVAVGAPQVRQPRRVAFICTRNSARSKLASALWRRLSAVPVIDAGTAPARTPHPRTLEVAKRGGLVVDLEMRDTATIRPDDLVVAVCDHVHETLPETVLRWHWSVPDPVTGTSDDFDDVCADIDRRVHDLDRALAAAPGWPGTAHDRCRDDPGAPRHERHAR